MEIPFGSGQEDRLLQIGTANKVTSDKDGNPWITRAISGTATLSGSNITSAGGDDIFIAKYDAHRATYSP